MRGLRVTVLGLGRFGGGIAVSRWLVEQGARVLVTDSDAAQNLSASARQLEGLPIEFHLGEDRPEDLIDADLIVASPAVAPTHSGIVAAMAAGVPVTTEIRLFIERCCAKIIGVTGTKGKSTTTAMLGRILSRRFNTHVGGNIGSSLLGRLDAISPGDLVVLELSSYMLHHLGAARWSPHVGLVTMVGADHLEWHGSREQYVAAKQNLLKFQTADDYAVVNETDAGARAMADLAPGRVVPYPLADSPSFNLRLAGAHNQVNAQGAYGAASLFGLSHYEAQAALIDFAGLPHRLETVHESGGIRWINDSIATIPEAAVAALESFPPKKVLQIVGGKDKHLPTQAMCGALIERAKAVFCIGATGGALAKTLEQSSSQSAASIYQCNDMVTAVAMARRVAQAGDVILLSPGFPSQDQFVNFEARGELFTELARSA